MSLNKKLGSLNRDQVAHLLRRTTFGPSIDQIKLYEGKTVDEILNVLFDPNKMGLNYLPYDPQSGPNSTWVYDQSTRADYLMVSYMQFYVYLNHLENFHIKEKMQEFLYMFAACGVRDRKPQSGFHLYNLCNYHVDKPVKDFLLRLLRDSLYLATLNNNQNTKTSPIEDAGREFLEMAALGKGPEVAFGDYTTYTEQDVREVSRILTGLVPAYVYTGSGDYIDPDTGIPRGVIAPSWHDDGDKTFSHRLNNRTIRGGSTKAGVERELRELVEQLCDRGAGVYNYYVRRMYRFFVSDEIDADTERNIIQPLVADLVVNQGQLLPVLRKLLSSQHFFDDKNIGAKIKSGMDFLTSVQNSFCVSMPNRLTESHEFWHDLGRDTIVRYMLENIDHEPMSPPTIAGYAGDWVEGRWSQAWVSHNNLGFRQLIADMITQDSKILVNWDRVHMHWGAWELLNKLSNNHDPEEVVDEILTYTLPKMISNPRLSYFLNDVLLEGKANSYWTTASNNEKVVQLEKLIRAIVQSPEFQLY
jgi:hypothetical protein